MRNDIINGTVKKTPLVSIVCVTYNAATLLPELFKSVSTNKDDEIELIIIDGNSTDETISVLKEHEYLIDFWLSEPDEGIYDAMNKALKYTNGQWIIFMGADDVIEDGFLYAVRQLKDANTVYYANVNYYGKLFTKIYNDYYLTKLNICHQSIFYPRLVFSKYKYDLRYRVYADYHLNLKCWNDPAFNFKHIDHFVASFRSGGYSAKTRDFLFEQNRGALYRRYLKPTSYVRYLNRTFGFWNMLKIVMVDVTKKIFYARPTQQEL